MQPPGNQCQWNLLLISEEDENICQECGGAYDDDDEEAQRACSGALRTGTTAFGSKIY